MLTLSTTGLLWGINRLSVGLCILAALAVSVLWARRSGARLGASAWVLALLLPLLAVPTVAALAPPHLWDEVAYGAALPRDYALAGRFFYNADYGPYSAFPSNYEALAAASLVLVGDVIPARVLNAFLALGLAVVALHLSRRLGVPGPAALLAPVLVLSAPALLGSVPMVRNDAANAFFQCLAVLSIADYARRRALGQLALGAFFLGTAVGTKYSSLQFALCLAPLAIGLILRGPEGWAERLRIVAVFGSVALVAALPWYARNFVVFGNPVFPFLNETLGAVNAFTPEQSTITREMFGGLSGYSWSTGTLAGFFSGAVRGFGWGPILLTVPGLLIAIPRRRDAVSVFLAAILASYGLLNLLAGFWQPRYVLSLLVLASAFATVVVAQTLELARRRLQRRWTLTAAVGVLILALGADSVRWQWRENGELVQDLLRLEPREFLERRGPFWRFADWVNWNTMPDARIGVGVNVQPFYYLNRGYFHIHPMTEKGNLQSLQTPEEFLCAFRALGLDWLGFVRYRDEASYPKARTPHMHAFLRRLNQAVGALERSGEIRLLTRVSAVRVYRIEGTCAAEGTRGRRAPPPR